MTEILEILIANDVVPEHGVLVRVDLRAVLVVVAVVGVAWLPLVALKLRRGCSI